MKKTIHIEGRVFDPLRHEQLFDSISSYVYVLEDSLMLLARMGIPTDKEFFIKHKEDFREYIFAQRDKYLSSAVVIPNATRNQVRQEYQELYDSTASAFAKCAEVYANKDIILLEPDERGFSLVDMDATKENLKARCFNVIDTDKTAKIVDAIQKIYEAKNYYTRLCAELELPTPWLGNMVFRTQHGGGVVTADSFWRLMDRLELDEEDFLIWVNTFYKIYLQKAEKA